MMPLFAICITYLLLLLYFEYRKKNEQNVSSDKKKENDDTVIDVIAMPKNYIISIAYEDEIDTSIYADMVININEYVDRDKKTATSQTLKKVFLKDINFNIYKKINENEKI